jgi:hypothetical protein
VRSGAGEEQLHGVGAFEVVGHGDAFVGQGERANTVDALAVHAQRLAGRRDEGDARTVPADQVGHLGHRVDHVLTVVENDEHILIAQ